MKKSGRGASYRKALISNLVEHLLAHKKIETTRTRGKNLMQTVSRMADVSAAMKTLGRRRGDNAPLVEVSIVDAKK